MTHTKKKTRAANTVKFWPIAVGLFIVLILFIAFHSIGNSLFFSKKERINVVVYSDRPMMFSIDLRDNINYAVNFYPDMEVKVPGGYGSYRIGGLGKLTALEDKPEIMSKTFSLAASTFVSYYFYPPNDSVHYGGNDDVRIIFPGIDEIMNMKSNAQFFDRIYLAYLFSQENQKQYKQLRSLAGEDFVKKYQGYFYYKSYRAEKKNIQIVYANNYKTAETIGTLLEGMGIRVSDYKNQDSHDKNCIVTEQTEVFSETAKDISEFFNCSLRKGSTDVYDIIFSIGPVERAWEVE